LIFPGFCVRKNAGNFTFVFPGIIIKKLHWEVQMTFIAHVQDTQPIPPKIVEKFFRGTPDTWWMRIPHGSGCKIVIFPDSFPSDLKPVTVINLLLNAGAERLGDFKFFLENAWGENTQGNKKVIAQKRPLWQIMCKS
jgi:hypothetical protein